MKKVIVMAAVALAAVFAEASSVNWTFAAGKDYGGYTVYVCADIATGGFKDVADIQSHLLGTGGTRSAALVAGARSSSVSGKADVSNAAGETVNFYYVLVDPTASGYWTMSSSSEAYTTAATHTDSNIAAANGTALLSGTKTNWATGTDPVGPGGDTPEPTSGLLLLVGGAMLALRRKQK